MSELIIATVAGIFAGVLAYNLKKKDETPVYIGGGRGPFKNSARVFIIWNITDASKINYLNKIRNDLGLPNNTFHYTILEFDINLDDGRSEKFINNESVVFKEFIKNKFGILKSTQLLGNSFRKLKGYLALEYNEIGTKHFQTFISSLTSWLRNFTNWGKTEERSDWNVYDNLFAIQNYYLKNYIIHTSIAKLDEFAKPVQVPVKTISEVSITLSIPKGNFAPNYFPPSLTEDKLIGIPTDLKQQFTYYWNDQVI